MSEPDRDEYDGAARYYDLLLEPFLHHIRRRFRRWLQAYGPAQVLDIGCGTGKQLSMIPEGTQAAGIDLSPAMLAQAERKVPGRCRHGDATALPFEEASFDIVYTQFALHEKSTEVIDGLLAEARRVLRPDGRLLVVDYVARPFDGAYARTADRVIHAIERKAGRTHYANYQVWMSRGGLDGVLSAAGWREDEAIPFYGGTIRLGVYRTR